MHQITLPETKPALEWINGRALQKVSPKRKHALAQIQFAGALNTWARATGAGAVGTEWRFAIAPPGEIRRPLVPDVAFLSYARLPYEVQEHTDVPSIAPDVVVEIISSTDRAPDIVEKVRVYLASGSTVVFLVDPDSRSVTVWEYANHYELRDGALVVHAALPGFELAVCDLFTMPQPK